MWTPRPYQRDAIEAGLDALAEGVDSLIVCPTGGGKAGILGTIIIRLFEDFQGLRILNLTHIAELVEQNYLELIGMKEWLPAGIYSAGLNRRELQAPILFAGIQSIFRKAQNLGQVDVVIIDEAHLIPKKGNGQYLSFLKELRELNPEMRLLGLTATPYRIDSGRLDEGDDKLFERIAHEVSIRELIEDGYLSTLVTKATATKLDVTGVKKSGGDFMAGALQAAVDKDDITRGIVDEIVAYGQNRKSWIIFGAGVEHANHLAEEVRRRGYSAGTITGDTPPGERKKLLADFKAGRLRCLTNASVLTTGLNVPGIDLLAMARPTDSTSLYVQICGRATRAVYAPGSDLTTREGRLSGIANGSKPNALILDFAGNIRRHGPIDMVQPRTPGSGKGQAPVKECPKCHSEIHASVMECPDCGHEFERQLSGKITQMAAVAPILSKAEPVWSSVSRRGLHRHSKYASPDSVRVEYWQGFSVIAKQWVAVENPKAAGIVKSWWKTNGGQEPPPDTVTEFMERAPKELRPIDQIRLEPDGKFFKVTGFKFAAGPNNDEVAKPPTRYDMRKELSEDDNSFAKRAMAIRFKDFDDEEIPF